MVEQLPPARNEEPGSSTRGGSSDSPALGLRQTREGKYWLLISVFLLVVGFFKNINLLLLLGYLLFVIAACNAVLAGRRLRIKMCYALGIDPLVNLGGHA